MTPESPIGKAVFLKSSRLLPELPPADMPEFAFLGRSNVGKSSLVNMLTGRKALAKVSGTPGKTRLINHFIIDDSWYLVDLPGYGYARRSQTERSDFDRMTWDYLRQRPNLVFLFLLVDIRHEPLKQDLEFIGKLGEEGVPFGIAFTKADKLSRSQIEKALALYRKTLLQSWEELPPLFVTSAETAMGREELMAFVQDNLVLPD